jgi:hypothetical protein
LSCASFKAAANNPTHATALIASVLARIQVNVDNVSPSYQPALVGMSGSHSTPY